MSTPGSVGGALAVLATVALSVAFAAFAIALGATARTTDAVRGRLPARRPPSGRESD